MVDNRYVGRGDSAKYYLADAEVLRLYERRRLRESDALAMLAREFARDPVSEDQRRQAHLCDHRAPDSAIGGIGGPGRTA